MKDHKYKHHIEDLDSSNPEKFLQAYQDLQEIIANLSVGDSRDAQNLEGTMPHTQFIALHKKYTPRYDLLPNQSKPQTTPNQRPRQ